MNKNERFIEMDKKIGWSRRLSLKGLIGIVLFSIVSIAVLLAPILAPNDPLKQNLNAVLRGPSLLPASNGHYYLLGTDQLGRDIFSRLLYGGRFSLFIGLTSVLVSCVIGVSLGLISGYFGRWLGAVIMRIADIQLSIPSILLAIVMVAVMGSSLLNVILVLAVTTWVTFARVIRSRVLTIKKLEYIDAARCIGVPKMAILFRHILPNVGFTIIVIGTMQIARMILLESSLSFLGLGVDLSTPTWGNMINDGQKYLTSAWWLCTLPGIAIVVTIVGINLLGDWLRDILDPGLD
jgi:peptide/nickel transport system permease protein